MRTHVEGVLDYTPQYVQDNLLTTLSVLIAEAEDNRDETAKHWLQEIQWFVVHVMYMMMEGRVTEE